MKELEEYLHRINNYPKNVELLGVPFDLTWRWCGTSAKPTIEVYEKADRHTLCFGTEETIMRNLKHSLADWDLLDPDREER